jgi:hypothetical protein
MDIDPPYLRKGFRLSAPSHHGLFVRGAYPTSILLDTHTPIGLANFHNRMFRTPETPIFDHGIPTDTHKKNAESNARLTLVPCVRRSRCPMVMKFPLALMAVAMWLTI